MPIYEWECPKCGDHREVIRKYEDRDTPELCECSYRDSNDPTPMDRVEISEVRRPRFPGQYDAARPWQWMPDHPPEEYKGHQPIN